jgi:integrase
MQQGKRTRALDSRGRPVPGVYKRDGLYIAGFNCPQTGKWRMVNLEAPTLSAARRERDSLIAALREDRATAPNGTTFAEVFEDFQVARKLAERTVKHEQHLLDRHLAAFKARRVQDITTRDVSRRLREMRDGTSERPAYAEWTRVAVYRILKGTLDTALRHRLSSRSPMDGLAKSEIPKQRNAKAIARLDAAMLERFVSAGKTERWRAALALHAYAGLRLGEVRGLKWSHIDFDGDAVMVSCSALPSGDLKDPKTEAGTRVVPMLPALRRALVEWKLRSHRTKPTDFVIATADGKPVQERNLRRAFAAAKSASKIDPGEARLSSHSLRHAFGSMLVTDLDLQETTGARVMGHSDPGFMLRCYARDVRDTDVVVEDVLARARAAGVGS